MEPRDPPPRESPATPPPRRARIGFGVLFAVATVLAGWVVWPFRAPLFLALVLASVLHGVFDRIARRLGGRVSLAAALTTLLLLLVVLGPLGAVVGFLAGQVLKGLAFVRDELGVRSVAELTAAPASALPPRVAELVDRALAALHLHRAQVAALAERAAGAAEHGTQRVLEGSTRALFHGAIALIAFYFFLVEGHRLIRWLERVSPLEAHQTRHLLDEFRSVSRASIVGAALTALFQGVAIAIGFRLTGVPHPVFFGVITLFAAFIPVIGTLLVWLPAVALLWLTGNHAQSIELLVWCLVLIVGVEHLGKPFILRAVLHGEEMHTGLVFLSLLGGIEMFGLIGLVLGPLIIAFFLAMVRIYEQDFRRLEPE